MPVWGAVVISGLIFGIYYMNSVQSIIATFLGIAILYVKTRSLAVCMVFHIINNGLATLMEHLAANTGSNIDMINNISFWVSIAVVVIAIIPSVVFFKSKGAEIKTAELIL